MTDSWLGSWCWGLALIAVTTVFHAAGIVLIARAMLRHRVVVQRFTRSRSAESFTTAVLIIGAVGLLLAMLHGLEALIWALAYVAIGAIQTWQNAVLYSVDSMTTLGHTEINLDAGWRLMGALEAAGGMLMFGISTAFMFTVLGRIIAERERRHARENPQHRSHS